MGIFLSFDHAKSVVKNLGIFEIERIEFLNSGKTLFLVTRLKSENLVCFGVNIEKYVVCMRRKTFAGGKIRKNDVNFRENLCF